MGEKYVVDGYCFHSEADAKDARNEIDGIEYLKKRINTKNPESVLAVYNKIIEKQLFRTPIGYGFLRELQQILYNSPEIEQGTVRDIPVVAKDGKKMKERPVSLLPDTQEKKYKNKITNLIILNIFLVLVIIIVMAITNNSDNINVLNYRARLEREYRQKEDDLAVWDQQLREKEQWLNSLEQETE